MDEYDDVCLKIETHSNRIKTIISELTKNIQSTTGLLLGMEMSLRGAGITEDADNIHKLAEDLMESYQDVGDICGFFGNDIQGLVKMHLEMIEKISKIYRGE